MKNTPSEGSWSARLADRFPWLNDDRAPQVGIALLAWLCVVAIFTITLFSHRVDLSVGDFAPRTIVAPYGVVDWAQTAKDRQAAMNAVGDVYSPNPSVLRQQKTKAKNQFAYIAALSQDTAAPLSEREQALQNAIPIGLPNSVWGEVLNLTPAELAQMEQDTLVMLSSVMNQGDGIRNTTLGMDEAKAFVAKLAAQETSAPSLKLFLTSYTQSLVVPNTFLNKQETAAKRRAAAAQVPEAKILKGEVVVQEGQQVTPADIQVLKQLGLLNRGIDFDPILGSIIFATAVVGLIGGYLWFLRRKLVESWRVVAMTGLIMVVGLAAADSLSGVPVLSYLVVPTAAIMMTALVDSGLGLVMAGVLALAVAVLTGADLNVALVAFFGGIAGVFGTSRLSQRYDILRAGLLVGAVNVLALLGLDVMQGAALLQPQVWEYLVWALVDGVFASVLAMGSIPLLEGPFGVITAMKLIELSNPNQPLLRKLLVEAPGTYHHSIMVGNLAEAATEAVGGNSLMARVGAYYHDIGKSKRPYFFVDNQFGAENPHDRLAPTLSAIIISSHVRDGVELAREYHVPEPIVNFIQQHHGTTLIRYFYQKALDQDNGEGVEESDFRYDGPRPQSKETAIVMLADASEATVRTLKNPSPAAIEQVVRRLIKERLEDGQLDESNLTLKELDVIARTFTRVLTGVFHQRIEYPDRVLKEMERSRGNGNRGGKPPRLVRRVGGDGSSGGGRRSR
ncbi:HD family phosphohydrolase [Sulfobacillus harzensis]|uniref:HDIG domain-containing protein n=1 Tax=Sulfobacillus harzensis TaxID=2729629 RepID=A0A7Y0Q496_9FIRM|nr:HDIG domain-containing metalloprotein [Sulfobacillus harzensis]NMP23014.1 HDIG domain-containing protein [Sulfobacillus harzensis]